MIQAPDSTPLFEYFYRLWPAFVTVIGVLAWFIRRDSKQVFLEDKITNLSKQIEDQNKALWKALNELQKENQKEFREISSTLGKIEGQIEAQSKNH